MMMKMKRNATKMVDSIGAALDAESDGQTGWQVQRWSCEKLLWILASLLPLAQRHGGPARGFASIGDLAVTGVLLHGFGHTDVGAWNVWGCKAVDPAPRIDNLKTPLGWQILTWCI